MLEHLVEKKNEIGNYIRASEIANTFSVVYASMALLSLNFIGGNFMNDQMEFSKNLSPYLCFSTCTLYVGLLQSFTLSQFKKYNITKNMIKEGTFDISNVNKKELTNYEYLAILDSGYGDMFD